MKTYGTATLKGATWWIEAEPHVSMLLKRWFKKSDRGKPGSLKLSHTPEVCRDLEWFSDRFPLEFRPVEALKVSADQHREVVLRLNDYFSADFHPRQYAQMTSPPRTYQARSAEITKLLGGLLVADDLGLGKTVVGITLFSDPEARPAIVVPPVHLQKQWLAKILEFTPMLMAHIVRTGKPYALPTFFGNGPDVVICPYSKLSGWAQVLAAYGKSVIFDEVHELRRDASQRYEGAEYLARAMKLRLGLSATPVFNYGGEIYNILEILRPRALGSREEFHREWCTDAGHDGKRKLKDPRAFGSWARDNGLIVRHTRAEVGRELQPRIVTIHTIDADARKLAEIEGDAATLARIILKDRQEEKGEKMRASEELSNKLRQAIGIAKAPAVADFVRMLVESGEQVLLAGWHREVYGIWEEKLKGIPVCYYTGSESNIQKENSKEKFLKGEAKVMFLSLRSGAGLDGLQDICNVVVFGELDWSPAVHEQLIGRVHRDGQDKSVLVYYLVADTGADPIISAVLGLKRAQVDGIRDPEGSLVQPILGDEHRIRKLAEDYLERASAREGRAAA